MRILLDTNALLWWLFDLPPLGRRARELISTEAVFVSAVSAAELATKSSLGKLEAPDDLERQIDEHEFAELPWRVRHGLALRELPFYHRDPFDRLLIAQARTEDLTIMTGDAAFDAYDVRLVGARK